MHIAAKRHGGALYVIATNPTERSAKLDLDLRKEVTARRGREVFEGRDVPLRDGRLQEMFEPLDTRVYSWPEGKGDGD